MSNNIYLSDDNMIPTGIVKSAWQDFDLDDEEPIEDGDLVTRIPIREEPHVGWRNLDPGDKDLVDDMAREIMADMALSMDEGEDVRTMTRVLAEEVRSGGMSSELVGWWISENRRDIEECACGVRMPLVEEDGQWPYCPNCGMV